jgi:hypothetical protein
MQRLVSVYFVLRLVKIGKRSWNRLEVMRMVIVFRVGRRRHGARVYVQVNAWLLGGTSFSKKFWIDRLIHCRSEPLSCGMRLPVHNGKVHNGQIWRDAVKP